VLNNIGSYVTEQKLKDSIKIKTISSKKFFTKYPLKFNVLIVDCEGFNCSLNSYYLFIYIIK
jgi:hypothetical protein